MMKILSFISGIILYSLIPLSVSAAPGDLVASATYTKSGCSWQLKEGGGTGSPGGNQRYEIRALDCNNQYIAKETRVISSNVTTSCNVALIAEDYTLSSTNCNTYEIREAIPPAIPAAPAWVHAGTTGCGSWCGTPFWVQWPAVPNAAYYEYSQSGQPIKTVTTTSFTTATMPDLTGKTRACNALNQCSAWTPLTAQPGNP